MVSPKIDITRISSRNPLSSPAIRAILSCLCRHYKVKGTPRIHCLITDNRFIRKINARYLSHDYPTDVIVFDLSEPAGPLEGEIIISVAMARLNSKRYGTSWKEECARYLIHAFLHLMGFSDRGKLRRRMERKEELLLALIKKKGIV